jgi:hypothetical protein
LLPASSQYGVENSGESALGLGALAVARALLENSKALLWRRFRCVDGVGDIFVCVFVVLAVEEDVGEKQVRNREKSFLIAVITIRSEGLFKRKWAVRAASKHMAQSEPFATIVGTRGEDDSGVSGVDQEQSVLLGVDHVWADFDTQRSPSVKVKL